jgi:predicted transcriptional regulator
MADALVTDQEIAILCDVMEGWGANLNEDKRKVLDQLIAKGFVVSADQESPAKYKLTSKAQQLLAERGAAPAAWRSSPPCGGVSGGEAWVTRKRERDAVSLTMISSAHEQYASAPNISRWRDRHAQREFWLRDE